MARTRDLVALSAILLAPLAALLLAQPPVVEPASGPAPATAPITVTLAEVTPAPALAPVVEPAPTPVAEPPAEPVLAPAAIGRDPGQAMLVHDQALVLHTAADAAWSSGRTSIHARPGHLIASRPASWDSLPQPTRDLARSTVVVYAGDGSACVATVGAPRVQLETTGEIYPVGDSDDGYDGWEPPTNKSVLRNMVKESYKTADDLLLLATQQTNDERPCQGEWARRADLPAPTVFGHHLLDEHEARELAAAVLSVVRVQPEVTAVETDYRDYSRLLADDYRDDLTDWDTFLAENTRAVRWDEVGGTRRIISIEVGLLPEPCSGQFSSTAAILLEQVGDQFVRLPQPGWFNLTALMDIDRDGTLEAVTHGDLQTHSLQAEGPNAATFRDSFMIDFNGCPC